MVPVSVKTPREGLKRQKRRNAGGRGAIAEITRKKVGAEHVTLAVRKEMELEKGRTAAESGNRVGNFFGETGRKSKCDKVGNSKNVGARKQNSAPTEMNGNKVPRKKGRGEKKKAKTASKHWVAKNRKRVWQGNPTRKSPAKEYGA